MRTARTSSGFTLIEVLLAISITVLVAVMSYQGLDSAINLSSRSELEADKIHRLNRVFDIISKDFKHIIPRKVRSTDGGEFVDAFYYNASAQPMLRFTRNGWTNPHAQRFQRSQLQRVNYEYDGDKLIRSSWQMVDRYDDSEATEITLLDKVESLTIRLLQQQADISQGGTPLINGAIPTKTTWLEKWPVNDFTQSNQASVDLPIAVEITLQVTDWGTVRRVFEIVDARSQQ